MEIFLGFILIIPFLYINYKIIESDLIIKKIPNKYLKYLLYILPLIYMYLWYFGYFSNLSVYRFIMEVILTLLIGFGIFHFGKWWAGDAKYLLVLSLLIPHIGIIAFIFSIAVITIIYLMVYFMWFWFGPNLWVKQKRDNLYRKLWEIKKDEFINKNKGRKKTILWILKWINIFFILFISIRLIRIHIITFVQSKYDLSIYDILSSEYLMYIIVLLILIIISISYIMKYIFTYIRNNIQLNTFSFMVLINIVWIFFLIYEYTINPSHFYSNITIILSLYLWIYIILKILLFAYKLVFISKEESLINVDNLQEWMTINKQKLYNKIKKHKSINMAYSDIKSYIHESINQNLNIQDIKKIRKIHNIVRNYHKKNNHDYYKHNPYVSIDKTFSFSLNIFIWFIIIIMYWQYSFVFT